MDWMPKLAKEPADVGEGDLQACAACSLVALFVALALTHGERPRPRNGMVKLNKPRRTASAFRLLSGSELWLGSGMSLF